MGIRLREKIGYGLGDTASSMLWKLFSVYLMFFYTDICGIDAWVVGVLFLVTRIWDSLLDPVVGLLCDRTSSRWAPHALDKLPCLSLSIINTFLS